MTMRMLVLLDIELKAGGKIIADPDYSGRAIVNTRMGGTQSFSGEVVREWVEEKLREAQWDDTNLFMINDVTKVTEPQ